LKKRSDEIAYQEISLKKEITHHLPRTIDQIRNRYIKKQLLDVLSATPFSNPEKHLKDCKAAIVALEEYMTELNNESKKITKKAASVITPELEKSITATYDITDGASTAEKGSAVVPASIAQSLPAPTAVLSAVQPLVAPTPPTIPTTTPTSAPAAATTVHTAPMTSAPTLPTHTTVNEHITMAPPLPAPAATAPAAPLTTAPFTQTPPPASTLPTPPAITTPTITNAEPVSPISTPTPPAAVVAGPVVVSPMAPIPTAAITPAATTSVMPAALPVPPIKTATPKK